MEPGQRLEVHAAAGQPRERLVGISDAGGRRYRRFDLVENLRTVQEREHFSGFAADHLVGHVPQQQSVRLAECVHHRTALTGLRGGQSLRRQPDGDRPASREPVHVGCQRLVAFIHRPNDQLGRLGLGEREIGGIDLSGLAVRNEPRGTERRVLPAGHDDVQGTRGMAHQAVDEHGRRRRHRQLVDVVEDHDGLAPQRAVQGFGHPGGDRRDAGVLVDVVPGRPAGGQQHVG
jgi:hypothetical protein